MSGPPTRPARPFGLTIVSVAVTFWGLLWATVGLSEPTSSGTIAAAIGTLAILLGIGLYVRHPLSWLAGLISLGLGAGWYTWGILDGRSGATLGAIGAIAAAAYLALRRDVF